MTLALITFNYIISLKMNLDFEYLVKRARLFFAYLDANNIEDIFPMREASKEEFEQKVSSGSVRKLKNFNDLIDGVIIGNSPISLETKWDIIKYLSNHLNTDESLLIERKVKQWGEIKKAGLIRSNIVINEAIDIANSNILGLSDQDRTELRNIINKSVLARAPK